MSRRPRSGMLLALVGAAALLAGIAVPMGVASQAGASPQIKPASVSSSAWAIIGTINASFPAGTAIDVDDDTVYFAATDLSAATSYIGAISNGSTSGAADDSVAMPQNIWYLATDSDDDTLYATPVRGMSTLFPNQNGILYEVNGRTMSLDDSSLPLGRTDIGYDRYLTQPAVDNDDDSVYIGSSGLDPEVYVKGFSGWQTITTLTGITAANFAVNQSDDTVYTAWWFDGKVTSSSGRTLSPAVVNGPVLFPFGLSVNSVDDSVYALGPTLGMGPSAIHEYAGRNFISSRSLVVPSIANRTLNFLSLAADGTRLVASGRMENSGAQIYLINPLTMTIDDTISTETSPDEDSPAQVTSSGIIYAPTKSGIKAIAKISGPGGTWSGSAGDSLAASLAPTPNVVNGRTITVDDSTVTSVSFGGNTTTFTKTGNSLSITVPPGTGTVSVTARLNGGNSVTLGTFTYGSTPPVPADPPTAPLNAVATAGDASATATWSPPTSQGSFPVTNYKATSSPGGRMCLSTAPTTSCTIDGLTNGTAYTVTVQALNGAGWSPNSASTAPVTPAAPPAATIVITGARGTGQGSIGRVAVQGVTTHLAGTLVQARVHLAGEIEYVDGSTRRVSDDETFTWQRLTKKKVYVYFTTEDRIVRSNRLIIDP